MVESFTRWCEKIHPKFNTGKTKELVMDFGQSGKLPTVKNEALILVKNNTISQHDETFPFSIRLFISRINKKNAQYT